MMQTEKIYSGKITKRNIDKVIQAVLPMEEKCINLTALLALQKLYFESNQKHLAFLDSIVIYEKSKEDKIIAVVMTSRMGVILHCFKEKISEKIEEELSEYFLNSIKALSIMGDKENSEIIEKIIFKSLGKSPVHKEDYKLLTLKGKEKEKLSDKNFYERACKNLNTNLKILIPPLIDLERILPLELAYQVEEVLAVNKTVNEDFFKKVLYKYISKNSLYAIKMQSKYLAKATINAKGFKWFQIGGVYTIPKHRNKGLAAALIYGLINDKHNQNKNFALFVKVKNEPARNMYKKLGFEEYCNFRISYF